MPACGRDGLRHSAPTQHTPPLPGEVRAAFFRVGPCLSLAHLVFRPRPSRPGPAPSASPARLSRRPRPDACACRPHLAPPGPAPAPPSAYLAAPRPCRWARAATLLRTVLRLARTCRKGRDQRWKAGVGTACLAHGRRGNGWAPTWAKGVTIMSSPCLRGDGTSGRAARRRPHAGSHLAAFIHTMSSPERVLPS